MAGAKLSDDVINAIKGFQRNEITEYNIYRRLSEISKGKNKETLGSISKDELGHYEAWKKYSGEDVPGSGFKAFKFLFLAKLMGLTFAIKLMEMGEENAQVIYANVVKAVPEARKIFQDEKKHEKELVSMIEEEKLNYIGSMVLGLNDALVELTGALAGFSFALQNTGLIGIVGLITGISAALSMMSSEFLSQKSDQGKNPMKASIYTGIAYFIAVLLLVFPFFIFTGFVTALAGTLALTILIIILFTYFISVIKEMSFKRRFLEMAGISMGVAALSFLIGVLVRVFLNISV